MMSERPIDIDIGEPWNGSESVLSPYNAMAVNELASDRESIGMEVTSGLDTHGRAFVRLSYSVDGLRRIKTRNAGRYRKRELPNGSPLHGMTCGEAALWIGAHCERDCLEALGVSHAEFYRRRRDISAYLEQDPSRADEDFETAYRASIRRV